MTYCDNYYNLPLLNPLWLVFDFDSYKDRQNYYTIIYIYICTYMLQVKIIIIIFRLFYFETSFFFFKSGQFVST